MVHRRCVYCKGYMCTIIGMRWSTSLKDETWPCYQAKLERTLVHVYNKISSDSITNLFNRMARKLLQEFVLSSRPFHGTGRVYSGLKLSRGIINLRKIFHSHGPLLESLSSKKNVKNSSPSAVVVISFSYNT